MAQEREINLKFFLLRILLKWRVLLVVSVLFAVALPAYKYWNAMRSQTPVASGEPHEIELDSELNVATLVELYNQYDFLRGEREQYDSIDVDLEHVPYVRLKYYVDIAEEDKGESSPSEQILLEFAERMDTKAADISSLYTGLISSEDFVNSITGDAGVSETFYVKYLESFETSGRSFSLSFALVGGMDEETLVATVRELIEGQTKLYQQAGAHKLVFVESDRFVQRADDLISDRNGYTSQMYSVNSQILTIEKSASDTDKEYAELIREGKLELGDKFIETEDAEVLLNDTKPQFSLKYALIGFILGLFLVALCYGCGFVLSGRMQEVDELKPAGIQLLESVEVPLKKKRRGLDARLTYFLHNNKRQLDLNQQIAAVVSAISLYAEQNDMKKLCLTSSLYGKLNEELVQSIISGLKDEGLSADYVDDMAYDKKSLRACAAADGTVLVEQVEVSRLSEIEKEIQSAKDYKVNIIGSVVFE